jgi:hypothetical protein
MPMSSRVVPSRLPAEGARREVAALEPELREILGRPPILPTEDLEAYNHLHDRVRSAVAPGDVIEELWIRDVVDLMWETLRLRRLKAKLIMACAHEGLRHALDSLANEDEMDRLISNWIDRKPQAVKRVDQLLARAGYDGEVVYAYTLAIRLDDLERIDRVIMQADARRNAVIREVDRHRDALAQRLRDAVTDSEDAEFETIPPQDDEGAA